MNILIIGAKGQLGIDLMARVSQYGWHPIGADLPELDITQADSVQHLIDKSVPLIAVVNAAAYTAVDQAESDADIAFAVNRDGPRNLSIACARLGVPLIHVSTDYVFNGLQTTPYQPSDRIDPLGIYGQSKAAGEKAVREHCTQHVIVRTAWLFGLHGPNFVKTMLRLGNEREVLKVVDDQIGSPTYSGDLASALLKVCAHVTQHPDDWGTYHFCNAGALTWYAFACKIFDMVRPYSKLKVKTVTPIRADHYPTPAPRPNYSVLDCTSFESTYAVVRRPWQEALKEMILELYTK